MPRMGRYHHPPMMHMLAQGRGGGGGGWFTPGNIKVALIVGFFLFSLLGGVIKKINERNAKKAAEKALERRRDEMLRTGRDESGALVNVSKVSVMEASLQTPDTSDADARRKLLELAERRRRELAERDRAEAVKRSAATGAQRSNPPSAANQSNPPLGRPMAQPGRQQQPYAPQSFASQRNEKEARRQQNQQAGKKAAAAAAKRTPQETARPSAMQQPAPPPPGSTPMHAAYALPSTRTGAASAVAQEATSSKVGAAMLRLGGNSDTAEWRRAMILSELLGRPVGLRPPDERTM